MCPAFKSSMKSTTFENFTFDEDMKRKVRKKISDNPKQKKFS
jgi:hypothetical protein